MPSEAYALNPDMLVGGQAVLDGVMMRSSRGYAVAVRRSDGSIALDHEGIGAGSARPLWLRLPVVRGSVVLAQSMRLGFRALAFAARQAGPDAGLETGASPAGLTASLAAAVAFAVALFVLAPLALTNILRAYLAPGMGTLQFNAIDGMIRVGLFFGYLAAISRLPDIRRVFGYHGAEHKVVYTFEAGEDLTLENARRKSRLHPRCGTSFLLFVLLISIAVFSAIPSTAPFPDKLAVRLVCLPLIAGIAYETIRFSSRHAGHALLRALIAPGLWLQRITTREPSDDQIEVAIAALRAALVFDLAETSAAAAVP
jgi:uncharacterized protein YqhQ